MNQKDAYIRQVKRALTGSRRQKEDILRDLEEAFASGLEHGESEAQVAERLGPPEELAANFQEIPEGSGSRRRISQKRWAAGLLVLALAAFGIWFYIQSQRLPLGVIGQANASTWIMVEGPAWDWIPMILLPVAGLAALAAAIVITVRLFRHR